MEGSSWRLSRNREDHCFLFETAAGTAGFAFCAQLKETEEARMQVERVLGERFSGIDTRVAYLGYLDYSSMDPAAGEMLGAFERHDPVWLALFKGTGAGTNGPGTQPGGPGSSR